VYVLLHNSLVRKEFRMGRKLTYSERAQRDQQRRAERERKAKNVAARRAKAKAEKEKIMQKDFATAKKAIAKYEQFYDSIINLHRHSYGTKKLKFESKLKKPKKPSDHSFKPKKFNFKEKEDLGQLKKESEYNFKEYCRAEKKSSFFLFVKIFGTQEKYEVFNKDRKNQYEELDKKKQVASKKHREKEEERKIKEQKEYDDLVNAYNNDLTTYEKKISDQKIDFQQWHEKLLAGDNETMEEACEVMFPLEFSFDDDYVMSTPTDSTVGYKIVDQKNVEISINLPSELNFLPEYGLKIKPSGKGASEFKISQKVHTEVADKVVCSLGFSYLKSIFNVLKTMDSVFIEVGCSGVDPKTGGAADLIFLSMEVTRDRFSNIQLSKIDVLRAVDNFPHQFRSTKTTKNIDGKIDRENLIWATDDDKNINLSKHIRDSFRSSFY